MKMKAEEFLNYLNEDGEEVEEKYFHRDDVEKVIMLAHSDAVKKWTLWCFNYHTPFEQVICKIWGGTLSGFGGRYYCEDNFTTQHLIEKWQKFETRGDARMLFFYCDLDSGLQEELVDWVMKNYVG